MRTYKTIKWILKDHIKTGIKTLWTYDKDNFTCIYKSYSESARIYTSEQMLELVDDLIKQEKDGVQV